MQHIIAQDSSQRRTSRLARRSLPSIALVALSASFGCGGDDTGQNGAATPAVQVPGTPAGDGTTTVDPAAPDPPPA